MDKATRSTAVAGLLLLAIAVTPAMTQTVGQGRTHGETTHDKVLYAMQRPIAYLNEMLDKVPGEAVGAVEDALTELETTRDDALAELDQPDRAIQTVTEGTQRAEDVLGAEINKQSPEVRAALHRGQLRIAGGRAQALTALRQR